MGSQRVRSDWATFTLLHLMYVNHPGIKRPQDPRVSNTTELTPAQATDVPDVPSTDVPSTDGQGLHALTYSGPLAEGRHMFYNRCIYYPQNMGRDCDKTLVLKTSTPKRGISLPLLFHWPKQGPWPYLTARGTEKCTELCPQKEERRSCEHTDVSNTVRRVSHVIVFSESYQLSKVLLWILFVV